MRRQRVLGFTVSRRTDARKATAHTGSTTLAVRPPGRSAARSASATGLRLEIDQTTATAGSDGLPPMQSGELLCARG
jgi:hypothetical protein